MKKILTFIWTLPLFFLLALPVNAQTVSSEIISYTDDTLKIITLVATASAVFFLIKAGYTYITSKGNPQALASAKKTIINTLLGLTLVIASNAVISIFRQSLTGDIDPGQAQQLEIMAIKTVEPSDGLTQILIDSIASLIQNIVESATSPIIDGIFSFLTTTPTLLNNQVIRNFWLINLGITNTLFVLVVAILGLQLMSASTFGFEEVSLRELLPKIGLSFLLANISLFLADYAIITCNALVKAVIDTTGGLDRSWIESALSPSSMISGTTPLIVLIFLVIFLIVSIVLLLLYISRLIYISLGAVVAPYIFLISALPKFADFSYLAIKTYVVSVFMVFIHVMIIQLAGSFLTWPDQDQNLLISIAVGIGLFVTLLKTPSLMMQMVMYTSKSGVIKKLGSQVINVITTDPNPNPMMMKLPERSNPRELIKV